MTYSAKENCLAIFTTTNIRVSDASCLSDCEDKDLRSYRNISTIKYGGPTIERVLRKRHVVPSTKSDFA